jgi:hypothetical protein
MTEPAASPSGHTFVGGYEIDPLLPTTCQVCGKHVSDHSGLLGSSAGADSGSFTPRREDGWQPIDTAPKDGTRVDLWAKMWQVYNDEFTGKRFADCYWTNGDSMSGRHAHWRELDPSWRPTHWMPLPEPPSDVA